MCYVVITRFGFCVPFFVSSCVGKFVAVYRQWCFFLSSRTPSVVSVEDFFLTGKFFSTFRCFCLSHSLRVGTGSSADGGDVVCLV